MPVTLRARGRVGLRIRGAGAQGARFFLRRAMRRCPNVGLASNPSIAQETFRLLRSLCQKWSRGSQLPLT